MSDFDPDAYLAKKTAPSDGFDPDAYLAAKTGADAGSPLDSALRDQPGDVVTVETPTGPAQFTRSGQRFYGGDELKQRMDSQEPAFRQRMLEGATSLLSGGGPLMDEMRGAAAVVGAPALAQRAANALVGEPNEPAGDTYRRVRDDTRRTVDGATNNASPTFNVGKVKLPILPMVGAAVPSLFAPLAAGPVARIASATYQGGASAAADSRADLTQGDAKGFAKDTGMGTALGAVGGAAGELLGAPLRWLSRRTGGEASAAKDVLQGQIQSARDKAVQSARGQLGNNTAVQGNAMESVMEVIRSPGAFPHETVMDAMAFIQSPQGQQLLKRAVANNIDKSTGALAAEPGLRSALAEATQQMQPGAVAGELSSRLDPNAVMGDLGKKAWNSLGQRAAISAGGAAVGGLASMATGHDFSTGASMGGLSGFAAPGVLQFLRNQSRNPALQHTVNAYAERILNGGANAVSREGAAFAPVVNKDLESGQKQLDEEDERAVQAFLAGN